MGAAYFSLLHHQLLRRWRAPRPRLFWLAVVMGGLMLTYAVVALVALGLALEVMLYGWRPGVDVVSFVNSHVPGVALSLLVLRFMLQRAPLGGVQPYLTLPLARSTVARFFVFNSLLSLHNALPLCFAIPFAIRSVSRVGGMQGALTWTLGIVAVLVLSDVLNTLARTVLGQKPMRFFAIVLAAALLAVLDAWIGPGWTMLLGWMLFNALAGGNMVLLGVCLLVVALAFFGVTRYLEHKLTAESHAARRSGFSLVFAPRTPVYNLLRLEMALIFRHRRPRQFVLVALLFSTVYTFFLLDGTHPPSALLAMVLGFLTSGMFALNYGPLMFGWESAYFDGLLARPVHLGDVVRSKLLLLQISCGVLFLVALPLFVYLAPTAIRFHAAMTLYNAGISAPFVLWLALSNRERIALQRGSFFNYQGISLRHMGWTIVLALPPLFCVLLWPAQSYLLVAVLGAGGIVLTLVWSAPLMRRLSHSRHAMATAFRIRSS